VIASVLLGVLAFLFFAILLTWLWVAFGVEEWSGRDRDRGRKRK
jgi:hypothetical protein